ncbi:MAG: hypothetical protein M3Q27_02010 [Actinomycetota bacterium]|nr:hypothetical protein [Actinomycetota bacterium]
MTARDSHMEQRIHVLPMGPHEFAVTVSEGAVTVNRKVTVSEQFVDDIGLWEPDEQQMVQESIAFLLEREPVSSIPDVVDLGDLANDYDDYVIDLKTRMDVAT